MTPFWIYSIGDATMLTNAFTGVAMVFNDGGNVAGMVGMGLIFSLLMLGGRAITKQRFDLEYLFIGFVLYMVLFVPKVSVHVEDAYTASGQDIDNIPIGLAVPMSIVTRVGHYLTITYETAFSVPSMTTSGYLDSLNILAKLDGFVIGTATTDSSKTGELHNSLVSYISTCVVYDASNPSPDQEVSWTKLETSEDVWGAMQTTFYNRFVTTWIPGQDPPEGSVRSCSDAYVALDTYMQGNFMSNWNGYLKFILRKDSPSQSVSDAMSAIGIASNTAQKFMLNALMRNLVREGMSLYSASTGEVLLATMKTQASEQRRYQWATEQTLFKEVARPLMAFIESFVVCLAPIMCFLVTIGPMGVDLAGKYFLSIVWISLWPPVMSIVNTYIYFAASKEVGDMIGSAGIDPTTLSGMESLYTTVGTWVATGGLMAASVPALTLTLVYGGAVTASALAGRMQGGGHINEKQVAPDLSAGGPVVSQESAFANNPNIGGHFTGMKGGFASHNFGQVVSSAISNRENEAYQVAQQTSDTLTKNLGFGKSDAETKTKFHEMSDFIRKSNSESDKMLVSKVDSFAKSHSMDSSVADRLLVAARGSAGVGTGNAMPVLQGTLNAAIGSDSALSTSDRRAAVSSLVNSIMTDSSYQRAVSKDHQEGGGNRFAEEMGKRWGSDVGERIAQGETAGLSASKALDRLKSLGKNMSSSQNVNDQELAALLKNSGRGEAVQSAFESLGQEGRNRFNSEMKQLHAIGASGDLNMMAQIRTLMGSPSGQTKLGDALGSVLSSSSFSGDVEGVSGSLKAPDMALLKDGQKLEEKGKAAALEAKGILGQAPSNLTGAGLSPGVPLGSSAADGSKQQGGGQQPYHPGAGNKPGPSTNPGAAYGQGLSPDEAKGLAFASGLSKTHLDTGSGAGRFEPLLNKVAKSNAQAAAENFDVGARAENNTSNVAAAAGQVASRGASGAITGAGRAAVDGMKRVDGAVDHMVDDVAPKGTPDAVKTVAKEGAKLLLGAGAGRVLKEAAGAMEAAKAAKMVKRAAAANAGKFVENAAK